MANKYKGNVCVSTGEYTDNSGQVKKSWLKVGVVFESDNGDISIKLEALPMAKMQSDGFPAAWLRIFENDKQNNKQQPRQQNQRPPRADNWQDDPDDIPF